MMVTFDGAPTYAEVLDQPAIGVRVGDRELVCDLTVARAEGVHPHAILNPVACGTRGSLQGGSGALDVSWGFGLAAEAPHGGVAPMMLRNIGPGSSKLVRDVVAQHEGRDGAIVHAQAERLVGLQPACPRSSPVEGCCRSLLLRHDNAESCIDFVECRSRALRDEDLR